MIVQTLENKKEIDLQCKVHDKLITNIVEQALEGITGNNIIELRKVCRENRYEYYQRVKVRYIVGLGMLGLTYKITQEIEDNIFFLIHDIIHQITIDRYNKEDSRISISIT